MFSSALANGAQALIELEIADESAAVLRLAGALILDLLDRRYQSGPGSGVRRRS
jgi:hypothetical protein